MVGPLGRRTVREAGRSAVEAADVGVTTPVGVVGARDPIERELAERTARQLRRSLPATLPGIAALSFVLSETVALRWVALWASFGLADAVRAEINLRKEIRIAVAGQPDPHMHRRLVPHYLSFGLAWGSSVLIAALAGEERTVLAALICVLVALALLTVASSASRWFYGVTAFAAMTPATIGLLIQGGGAGRLGAVAFVYVLISVIVHHALHASIVDAVRTKQANVELAGQLRDQIADRDPLTGLLNRRTFMATVERAATTPYDRRGGPGDIGAEELTVVVGNLRRLTAVNELYGDESGNRVLTAVAERLQALGEGVIGAARLGGDEFAIATSGASGTGGHAAALLASVTAAPISLGALDVEVSFLVEHASGALAPGSAADLLARATARLQTRRSVARASASAAPVDSLHDRRRLADVLRAGVRHAGVRPWFQPIMSSSDGSIVGWEALARWQSPEHGLVLPMRFLPLVAMTGRMHELLGVVVGSSAELLARLDAEAPAIVAPGCTVHVNVTPEDLRRPGVADELLDPFLAAGIDPARLVIEVTEQDILEIDDAVRGNLARLDLAGAHLAVDDFGTGYSSLTHLLDLPTDHLKIDRRFVSSLASDASVDTLVQGMISLARGLSLVTVAEGVETPEQMARLAELGCTQYQGYLVAPAMPLDEAVAFARGRAVPVQAG